MADKIRATVKDQERIRIRSATFIAQKLDNLVNVDAANPEDGSLLIYEQQTSTWKTSRTLDKQFVEGGEF